MAGQEKRKRGFLRAEDSVSFGEFDARGGIIFGFLRSPMTCMPSQLDMFCCTIMRPKNERRRATRPTFYVYVLYVVLLIQLQQSQDYDDGMTAGVGEEEPSHEREEKNCRL